MKVQFSEDIRIFVACGQTNMRESIDGLSAIVSQTSRLDPFLYALNQETGLMNYLEDGHCKISNNIAENSIRLFTHRRKKKLAFLRKY